MQRKMVRQFRGADERCPGMMLWEVPAQGILQWNQLSIVFALMVRCTFRFYLYPLQRSDRSSAHARQTLSIKEKKHASFLDHCQPRTLCCACLQYRC
ncbi:hypothetical protein TNCV_1809591 [Trichonephila clavipes]|nr:hypothetical protein TNCV_1809591 [Trichonephila clavipes]